MLCAYISEEFFLVFKFVLKKPAIFLQIFALASKSGQNKKIKYFFMLNTQHSIKLVFLYIVYLLF